MRIHLESLEYTFFLGFMLPWRNTLKIKLCISLSAVVGSYRLGALQSDFELEEYNWKPRMIKY